MMVMTDLIKDEKGEDKRGEFINIIENQLDKMKWLITNLLKISKLDAGTTEFKHEKVSMKSVLNRSLKPFYVTCDIKQIEIINSAEDFDFIGDSSWTGEAIENIIKNCIEHTDKKVILNSIVKKQMFSIPFLLKMTGVALRRMICRIFLNAFITVKIHQTKVWV